MEYINSKHKALCEYIAQFDNAVIAFSGGVDSTLLLKVATDVLGSRCAAITASLPAVPQTEQTFCKAFCNDNNIIWTSINTNDISKIPYFTSNPQDRCYHCKKWIFEHIIATGQESYGFDTVMEGSNTDDLGDYRPGLIALKELGIVSPLIACGISKRDVRDMSRALKLPTSDKPSSPCLATRIPYGSVITTEKLGMIENAEAMLHQLGIINCRVRLIDNEARIEVSIDDISVVLNNRELITQRLHELGFTYIALDLDGFRSGSLNLTLTEDERKINL